MITWTSLTDVGQINELIAHSHIQPCLIFKHSTRCSISSVAKSRLESNWDFGSEQVAPYFVDVILHRDVSDHIGKAFPPRHESPQALLIHEGKCIYHASHLGITLDDLRDSLSEKV